MDFYFRNEGLDGCYLYDPLAVALAVDPSLCQAEQYHVEVEDQGEFTSGTTVADYRSTRLFKDKMKEVTWVCYKVDAERFERMFRENSPDLFGRTKFFPPTPSDIRKWRLMRTFFPRQFANPMLFLEVRGVKTLICFTNCTWMKRTIISLLS